MDIIELSKKVSDLEKRVETIEKAFIRKPATNNSGVLQRAKQMSAKEFLLSRNLLSAVDKTLALAYYLEKFEQMSSFNINDIAGIFQAAKEKPPTNLNDMINKNIAKGYLMEAQEQKDFKKAWVLTATGERLFEEGLNS